MIWRFGRLRGVLAAAAVAVLALPGYAQAPNEPAAPAPKPAAPRPAPRTPSNPFPPPKSARPAAAAAIAPALRPGVEPDLAYGSFQRGYFLTAFSEAT